MNKKLLIGLLLCLTLSGYAQEKRRPSYQINWAQSERHELRAGFGFFPIIDVDLFDGFGRDYGASHLFDEYDRYQTYRGKERVYGAFNLDYTYRVSKRWELGATASFVAISRKSFDIISDQRVSTRNKYNLGLMATARYLWLERDYVRLYSSASLGVGYLQESVKKEDSSKRRSSKLIFNGELTYFGVAVGKRLFGYADCLTLGTQGCFKMGIGYKF